MTNGIWAVPFVTILSRFLRWLPHRMQSICFLSFPLNFKRRISTAKRELSLPVASKGGHCRTTVRPRHGAPCRRRLQRLQQARSFHSWANRNHEYKSCAVKEESGRGGFLNTVFWKVASTFREKSVNCPSKSVNNITSLKNKKRGQLKDSSPRYLKKLTYATCFIRHDKYYKLIQIVFWTYDS